MGKNTLKKKLQMEVLKAHRDDKGTFVKTLLPTWINIILTLAVVVFRKTGVIEEGSSLYTIATTIMLLVLPAIQFLFFVFIFSVSSIVEKRYDKDVARMLPDVYLLNKTWVQIAKAVDNSLWIIKVKLDGVNQGKGYGRNEYLARYNDGDVKQLEEVRESIIYIKENMFKGSYLVREKGFGEVTKKDSKDNEYLSYLWLEELTKSPMIERISVLYQIDTWEKQKLFSGREIKDLIMFFDPLVKFADFIKEEWEEIEKVDELKRGIIEQKKKNEIDEMFQYGMKRLDKIHEVQIYEHDREVLNVSLDEFE